MYNHIIGKVGVDGKEGKAFLMKMDAVEICQVFIMDG